MSRWFRHYAGMVRDSKFVGIAVRSKQPLERVVFVWGWMLESASEREQKGAYSADPDEIAYTLRCNAEDVTSILTAMENVGMIAGGIIVKWSSRQFESDTSNARVARFRAKNAGKTTKKRAKNVTPQNGNGGVTLRNGAVTPPEADTDRDTPSLRSGVSVLSDGRPEVAAEPEPAPRIVEAEILPPEPVDPEKRLFETGKAVLASGPNPIAKGGGLIAKLLKAHGGNVAAAQERVDRAARAHDPGEFLSGCIRSSTGPPYRPDPHLSAARELMEEYRAKHH